MASFKEQKPQKQLIDARSKFDDYLRKRQVAGHYVSVSLRKAPLRRQDGGKVTSKKQLATIRDYFRWDNRQQRWKSKYGGRIVTEDEIYDVILSFQRSCHKTRDKLWRHVSQKVEGIHRDDVVKAIKLWNDHDLGSLNARDDIIWGGVAEPRSRSTSVGSGARTSSVDSSPDTELTTVPGDVASHSKPVAATNRRFHAEHSNRLHVGTSRRDGTDVWVSLSVRTGMQEGNLQPTLYDGTGTVCRRDALDIVWQDEYNPSKFPIVGPSHTRLERERGQRRAQSQYFYNIIQQNLKDQPALSLSPPPPPRTVGRITVSGNRSKEGRQTLPAPWPASKPATEKRRRKTHVFEPESSSEDEIEAQPPRPTKRAATEVISIRSESPGPEAEPIDSNSKNARPVQIPANAMSRTSLLVSADHMRERAPANVPMSDCTTTEQLFDTLVLECNLKGKAANELSEVSATYSWNQKQHLIRKGRTRDWDIFCSDITKAWDREASRFAEDGCEIQMLAHVPA